MLLFCDVVFFGDISVPVSVHFLSPTGAPTKPVWEVRLCRELPYRAFIVLFLSLHPLCLSKCNGAGEEDGWYIAWDASGVRTVLGQIGELCFTNFVT